PKIRLSFCSTLRVSVDHWRAGLRAADICPLVFPRQRVSRSLARWPARRCRGLPEAARPQSVSRSLARWPARRFIAIEISVPSKVSVDHWRAGLRAHEAGQIKEEDYGCQSITGALACAPDRVETELTKPVGVSRSLARWPARPAKL